jgi:hypothetical protein
MCEDPYNYNSREDAKIKKVLHCWMGRLEYAEQTYGRYSDEWVEVFNLPSSTCMLKAGHNGPHRWTKDSNIIIQF